MPRATSLNASRPAFAINNAPVPRTPHPNDSLPIVTWENLATFSASNRIPVEQMEEDLDEDRYPSDDTLFDPKSAIVDLIEYNISVQHRIITGSPGLEEVAKARALRPADALEQFCTALAYRLPGGYLTTNYFGGSMEWKGVDIPLPSCIVHDNHNIICTFSTRALTDADMVTQMIAAIFVNKHTAGIFTMDLRPTMYGLAFTMPSPTLYSIKADAAAVVAQAGMPAVLPSTVVTKLVLPAFDSRAFWQEFDHLVGEICD